jgi:hypothetical protein
LLPGSLNTPYIDSAEHALARDRSVITGYLVKLKEFEQVLTQNAMLFKDVSNLSWIELYKGYFASGREFKHIYFDAVKQKVKNGIVPSADELRFFSNSANFSQTKLSDRDGDLFQYIVWTNYIFTFLDS